MPILFNILALGIQFQKSLWRGHKHANNAIHKVMLLESDIARIKIQIVSPPNPNA